MSIIDRTRVTNAVANAIASGVLDAYYTRRSSFDAVPSNITLVGDGNRPFHFIGGKMNFQCADSFLETLRAAGLQPRPYPADPMWPWRRKAEGFIRYFAVNPAKLGDRPIIGGHSEGGHPVYAVAALAKEGKIGAIRKEFPGLRDISTRSLEELGERLFESALFVTIATPHNGMRMSRFGRGVNRILIEPHFPKYISDITEPNLEALYESFRQRPDAVIDVNLVGGYGKHLPLQGRLTTRVLSAVLEGGMRAFEPLFDPTSESDGIVPLQAARLNGPIQDFVPYNHWQIIEMAGAAVRLIDLIHQADEKREASRFSSQPYQVAANGRGIPLVGALG